MTRTLLFNLAERTVGARVTTLFGALMEALLDLAISLCFEYGDQGCEPQT